MDSQTVFNFNCVHLEKGISFQALIVEIYSDLGVLDFSV